MEPNDLRAMVTAVAAQIARRTVDAVDAAGLTGGHIKETTEAGGIRWDVSCVYWPDAQMVSVQGEPHAGPDPVESEVMGMIVKVFGGGPQEGADVGQFAYMLPVGWLPVGLPTTADQSTRGEV